MTTRYYVHGSFRSGSVEGPFEAKMIRKMLQANELSANTQVCVEGTEEWKPLSAVPELGPTGSGSAPPPAAPPLPTAGLPKAGYVGPVLATIFCCLIGGIVSIVYTSKANTALVTGDMAAYRSAMSTRQGWITASVIIGLLIAAVNLLPLLT